jgi:hypothetical protein
MHFAKLYFGKLYCSALLKNQGGEYTFAYHVSDSNDGLQFVMKHRKLKIYNFLELAKNS